LDAWVEALGDIDLSPLVAEWEAAGANAKYVKQVRRFIPEKKRFLRNRFTKGEIRRFLDTLTRSRTKPDEKPRAASPGTKNRYRAALSSFAGWLSERDVIATNPVRDVKGKPNSRKPVVYLETQQAMALVKALPVGEQQAAEALMAATGLEWGALAEMRRRDVDLEERTFHAFPGLADAEGKTRYRSRIVVATEDWAWSYIERHIASVPPNARVFTLREDIALRKHRSISKAIGLPRTKLHHWRHTYAVAWLKRGGDHQILKNQLGHSPRSTLIYTTYGPWIVTTADYKKRAGVTEKATANATTPETED
jgi:integrase